MACSGCVLKKDVVAMYLIDLVGKTDRNEGKEEGEEDEMERP